MNITKQTICSAFDKIAMTLLECNKNTRCNKGVSDDSFSDFPILYYILSRNDGVTPALEVLLEQRLIDWKNAKLTSIASGVSFEVPHTRSVRLLIPFMTSEMRKIYPFESLVDCPYSGFDPDVDPILVACNFGHGTTLDPRPFNTLLERVVPLHNIVTPQLLAEYILLQQYFLNMSFVRPEMRLSKETISDDELAWFSAHPDIFVTLAGYEGPTCTVKNIVVKRSSSDELLLYFNFFAIRLTATRICIDTANGEKVEIALSGRTFVLDQELYNEACMAKVLLFNDNAFVLLVLFDEQLALKQLEAKTLKLELQNCRRTRDGFVRLSKSNTAALLISNRGSRGVLNQIFNVDRITFTPSVVTIKRGTTTKLVNLADGIISIK